jgi:hypothetical protein
MSYNKLVNGVVVAMTQEEITARQAEEAAWASAKLAAVLPAYRYEQENAGITLNGVTILTDLGTRTNLLGAKELATSISWKTPNGFVVLTAQQVSDIATAVGVHVQKCFSAEATVQANIGNYTTEQQIKDAFDAAYAT